LALIPGVRLGVYEITAAIGEGGMGQVFRARDTTLHRDVALKVLPDSFAGDPERLGRFTREAQTLASLNHPNIAHIHGLEESGGVRALVMELVEGEDLSQRIARGSIPIDEALPIAKQIADALEAAHEQGIIHRDLKPANVKVRADGTVKVLDFGLAKAVESAAGSSTNLSMSPTMTTPAMTQAGIILGTAAYMSPEQARGKAVDRRADIWSFGCVLFEMLAGRRPFDAGETVSDAVAAILKTDPDWAALPANTPPQIHTLLRRCLQKDLQKRLPHIGTARLEIDEALAPSTAASTTPATPVRRRAAPWVAAAAALAATAALLVFWAMGRTRPSGQPVRLQAGLGADVSLLTDQGAAAVLSPDGQVLVFAAKRSDTADSQLFVRHLNELAATALAGTEGARNPFFSPDGAWVGFFAGGKLKKIATGGGAVVTLCEAPNGRAPPGPTTAARSCSRQTIRRRSRCCASRRRVESPSR
jgi:eukaryotic-like serine/threonine-protein kinase